MDIYGACYEKGYLGSHAEGGWFYEVNHFGNHYDLIQINTMWTMIMDHSKKTINSLYQDAGISEEELQTLYDIETDRLNSIMINSGDYKLFFVNPLNQ